LNKYLEKIARSEVKEHQSRVIDKLEGNSIVAAHSMGSGKTLTALLAAEKAQKKYPNEHVTAIVPASLVSNMKDQAVQHGVDLDMDRFEVTTYDKASNDVNRLREKNHSLIIVDEAHKLRNKDTKRSSQIEKILKSSRKSLLLSGTPSYNRPEDIAVLVNKAAGVKVLPDNAKDFEDRFIGRRKVEPGFFAKHVLGVEPGEVTYLKNQGELREALSKYIDAYDAQEHSAGDFPTAHHRVIKVNMSPEQKRMYKFLEDDMPAPIKWKIRLGLPLSKKESSNLNAFSTGVRQVSNSTRPYSQNPDKEPLSPKQLKMADSIEEKMLSDKNYRGISYSNYIESGLKPLSEELHRRGISHAIYDGSLSQKEKDSVVEKYNKGEIKQLLISSSGAEGLNTKGTKLVQVMEPHFNKSKIDQVVARAVRYKSHEHLPEDERHVNVEHYHSVMEPGLIDKVIGQKTKTIEEYLHEASDTKDKLRSDIMALTKAAGERMNKYLQKIAEASDYVIPVAAGAGIGAGAANSWHKMYANTLKNDHRRSVSALDSAKAEYADNKKKIRAIGEVKVESNDWAKKMELDSRYRFLKNRNKDLISSKKALEEEVNETKSLAEQYLKNKGKTLGKGVAAGVAVGGLIGLGRSLYGREKQAEASDYVIPVAAGVGIGAGAGYGINRVLTDGAGHDFKDTLSKYVKAKASHEEAVENYLSKKYLSPKVDKKMRKNLESLADKKEMFNKAMQHANSVQEALRAGKGKYLKIGAAAGGIAGLGIGMHKAASDDYSNATALGAGTIGAGAGVYGAHKYLSSKIDPLQRRHDAIKSWAEHDLKYVRSEADRVGSHVAPAYEELGRLRDAGAEPHIIDAQRAKADRLYDLYKEKLKAVDSHLERSAASLPKLDNLSSRISKYTKMKNPAMLGAGILAGGTMAGLGKLYGQREVTHDYE